MKPLLLIISFFCLALAGFLFYEQLTWTNPSMAMMTGGGVTEYFILLTEKLTGLIVNTGPRFDSLITLVNTVWATCLLVVGIALLIKARKSTSKPRT